jgi:hypothetical protein
MFIATSTTIHSQNIHGKITASTGEKLPFSSILIKGTSIGVTANNDAAYSFNLIKGKYIFVCQHIGYETIEKEINVTDEDIVIDFVLVPQQLLMKEFVVKSSDENPAYAIIRQAIKKRDFYNNQIKSFTCDLYNKNLFKLRAVPNKIMGQKMPEEDKKSAGLDSTGKGIIYLSESVSKIYKELPDHFKMEVKSSRVSGSNSFGFAFPAFISLYSNNVSIFQGTFNQRGFISPIADGAIRYYKYKMLGTFVENGKVINSIRVTPRRNYEPLFSGIINIIDDDWKIHSFDLQLTKTSQLELLDTIKITQLYVPITPELWNVKNQVIYFNLKFLGIDAIGNFVSVYSNYNLNPVFDKSIFNRVVIKYDTAVNKKPKNYWDTIRPVPLEPEEIKDYKVKDSIYQRELDSAFSKNNIDSLRKKQGPIKIKQLLYPGINRTHYNQKGNFDWGIDPFLTSFQYNTAEGLVGQLSGYYEKNINKSPAILTIEPYVRYGFSNTHLNSWIDVTLYSKSLNANNKLKRNTWFFSGGKSISQYNNNNPIKELTNSFFTLFDGNNQLKSYENYFGIVAFRKKFENGLSVTFKAKYEDRMPLFNTSNYTFFKKDSIKLTENYPIEKVPLQEIKRHQALVTQISLIYKPGQRYIQFPDSKVSMGSRYPTFSLSYAKGIFEIGGSDVDFDKWSFDIYDDKNLKLLGLMKYKFTIGGFLNSKLVPIQDYKHFDASTVKSTNTYVNGFQLMGSYVNSNTAPLYVETHIEHHFNGLITNKIPFLKKLNWNLVAGTNNYFISKDNYYVEYFVGLENILKIFRLDFVSAYQNGKYQTSSIILGAGGLLGGSNTANKNEIIKTRSRRFAISF